MPFHSRKHFEDLRKRSDQRAQHAMKCTNFFTYGIPNRKDPETGSAITWEPEFGPTLTSLDGIIGAQKTIQQIEGIKFFPNLTRDFSYVSASIHAPEGYTGRLRFNFYREPFCPRGKRSGATRKFSGAKIGFKTAIKSTLRQEYEAAANDRFDLRDAMNALGHEHQLTLPSALANIRPEDIYMKGLICVERAGFETTHTFKDGRHTFMLNYAGSYDAGTCNDIREGNFASVLSPYYEVEMEATALRSPVVLTDDEKAEIINASMNIIAPQLNTSFADFKIPDDDPRVSMGQNTRAEYEQLQHSTPEEIAALAMQPSALLTKAGYTQLTELFDGPSSPLIAPKKLHYLAQTPEHQAIQAVRELAA